MGPHLELSFLGGISEISNNLSLDFLINYFLLGGAYCTTFRLSFNVTPAVGSILWVQNARGTRQPGTLGFSRQISGRVSKYLRRPLKPVRWQAAELQPLSWALRAENS